MDQRVVNDLPKEYPVYREPPKRKHNLLRAFLIMVGAGVVAGCVWYGLTTFHVAEALHLTEPVQQETQPQAQQPRIVEKTVIVNEERHIPYPTSQAEVSERYGGDPADWFRWRGGWV